jgi:threonine aldolase
VSSERGFASDNSATIHPEVLEAIVSANAGHTFAYGHDLYTRLVERRFAEVFGADARAFLIFNGTGANVLCMRAACRPWEAVICSDCSHLNLDEGGAPEWVGGVKLLAAPAVDGRLTPDAVASLLGRKGDEHAVQPRVLSITQATELGTVYGLDEVRALADVAHAHGLLLHIDGARLANAAAALDVSLPEASFDLGADLVSFGGTKNGLMVGEAVIVRDAALAEALPYLRKQSLQLASKMRYLAAQFEALLRDDLWHRCAAHANAMAAALARSVGGLDGVTITRPVEANAVFAVLPAAARAELAKRFDFYTWDEATGEVRWMCSWDTTAEDVGLFAAAVEECLQICK